MCHVTQGWGGVGFGGVITLTYLRTPMMLRHGTFTCTCAHTWCYVEDVSRHAGVGWGGVITFTYLRTPMMLRHGTFTCTCAQLRRYVMLRWRCVTSRRGGVGWGNSVGRTCALPWCYAMARSLARAHNCAHTSCYVEDVSRHAGVGWGGVG